MKMNCCWVCLLLFEIVSGATTGFAIGQSPSHLQHPAALARSRRQTDAGSILGDIFQIPIQTLTAVSQLFNTAKKQRDKRRPYQNQNQNYDNGDNDGGYSTYNNGQPAASSNNANSNYNNNGNSYNNNANYNNNNKFNGAQTAYNNGYNAYNNGNRRPSYNGNNNDNSIGANAFSKPGNNNNYNNNYNNNMFNRPFHYLSQYMSGYNNRVSRTHGALISQLMEAADGSSFKI